MERNLIEKRMHIYLYIVVILFLILVSRLAYMQLLQNDKFSTLARENRMRLITITAPRGEVFDRNGIKLVGNQPVYTVSLVNLGRKDMGGVVQRLAGILGTDAQEIQQKIDQQERLYEPVKLATRVSEEIVIKIEEQRLELPGVEIDIEPLREYPNGNMLAHVMGYVREINPEQLAENKDNGYKSGDRFGQSGLEYTYEQYLRGRDGGRQVEVDSKARPVRDLGVLGPVPGNNLMLTIDHKVQKAAEEALARSSQEALRQGYGEARAGAAVAIDVRSGAVLAMASYPGFDPVKLSGVLSQKEYNEVFNSPWNPMLNRALLSYAPGSTFKMIVAMAGLETATITPQTIISDPGYFIWDNHRYNDWKLSGHGQVDMVKAIKVSCNTYFYQLGLKVGIDNIAKIAREFGLGEKTGIELPGEYSGVVPGPPSKFQLRKPYLSSEGLRKVEEIEQRYEDLMNKATGEEEKKQLLDKKAKDLLAVNWELAWHDYDTIITSIGQGDSSYTILGMANYVAAIANGGILYKPYLVQKVIDPSGNVIEENQPVVVRHTSVSPETLAVVREGMREVVLPPNGTAHGFFTGFPPVAAKTGTGEVFGHDNHAQFVAFAPYAQPEIAVAVVMEFAGHGGAMAGPVAESMLAAYFGLTDLSTTYINTPE
ncbi:MAG: penicillin-binding protein 2 [Desulfotomaculaceae bacterium]|nr:penicillin-binding protein 2 [Desulfotomaculaceae bacterium]